MKAILLFIFLATGFTSEAQSTKDSIPFTLTESGHILIKAKVEGIEGNFIFDTGAGHNLLFKSFAKKIGPKETYNFFVGHRSTGEAITLPIYTSTDLTIGGQNYQNQIYSTIDLDFGNIDGLISLQPFKNTPVTIDYENKILAIGVLSEAEKKRFIDIQVADYAGKALDIFTNIQLNDTITIQVLLDGGAGNNSFWINSKFLETLRLDKTKFEVKSKASEFDPSKSNLFYIGTVESIKTENNLAKVKDPKTFFVEGLIYEGKTGIEWLGKKISISLPDKKIYIIK